MYKGETSVPEEKLDKLMRAAESLKVGGLLSSKYTLKLRRLQGISGLQLQKQEDELRKLSVCNPIQENKFCQLENALKRNVVV